MRRFNFIGMFVLLLINVCVYGQKKYGIGDHRSIHLTPATKTIDATVTLKKERKISPDKVYYWYDNTTIQQTQGGFSGYLLDGTYNEYAYPNNNLCLKGEFSNGLKTHVWISWHDNGNIKERSQWKKGRLYGKKYTYNTEGNIVRIEHYKKGLLNGKTVDIIADNSVNTYYKNGIQQSRKNNYWSFFSHKKYNKQGTKATEVPEIKTPEAKTLAINSPNKSSQNKEKKKRFGAGIKSMLHL